MPRGASPRIENVQPRAHHMCPEFHQKLPEGTIGDGVSRLRQIDPSTAEAIVATVPKEWDASREARIVSNEPLCRRAALLSLDPDAVRVRMADSDSHAEDASKSAKPDVKGRGRK